MLADRQTSEDRAAAPLLTCRPRGGVKLRRARRRAPAFADGDEDRVVAGDRAATSGRAASSIASASAAANPRGVWITSRLPVVTIAGPGLRADASCSSRPRSAAPEARRSAGRRRFVPSRARAGRCRARRSPARRRFPRPRSASASSAWVESCRSSTSLRIAPCRSNFFIPARNRLSGELMVSLPTLPRRRRGPQVGLRLGDRQRRREPERRSPAVPTSRLCSSAAWATSGGRPTSTASSRPAPRVSGKQPRAALHCADVGEQVVVDRLDDGAGGGAGDGVAAEGRGVVAGTNPGGLVATSSAPIGRPFASPLARVTASGRSGAARRRTRPCGRSRLHLVEEQHRLELVRERARLLERLGRSAADAAFAEHRLHDDRGGIGADRRPTSVSARREANAGDRAARTRPASPAGR